MQQYKTIAGSKENPPLELCLNTPAKFNADPKKQGKTNKYLLNVRDYRHLTKIQITETRQAVKPSEYNLKAEMQSSSDSIKLQIIYTYTYALNSLLN